MLQHVERHATVNDDVERALLVVLLRYKLRIGAQQVRVQRLRQIALVFATFAEANMRRDVRRLSFALQDLALRIAAPSYAPKRPRRSCVVVSDDNVGRQVLAEFLDFQLAR